MDRARKLALALIVGLLAPLLYAGAPAQADTVEGCASPAEGGEWPSYGQNLSNSRNQELETTIGPENVGDLEATWSLTAEPTENMRSTPVVADGCVFVTSFGPGPGLGGSATASVYAANADTGEVVWQTRLPSPPGVIVGTYAPAVANGRVYVAVSATPVPYVVALDQETGEDIWIEYLYEGIFDPEPLTGLNASMVHFDGMLFVPLTGADGIGLSHPAFYIIDAQTGTKLKRTHVISEEYWASNQSGGGIWATGVVDTESKYLYVGTSNPYNKRQEHPHTNAILKIDMDQKRFTFGEIVSHYKGDVDYDPEAFHDPECRYLAELVLVGFSTFCGQDDVDFGASPNLFRDSDGRLIVGELQKSGTYHAVDAETMEPVWTARELAERSAGGNSSTSAMDETSIYVAVNNGVMYALDQDTGTVRWRTEYPEAGSKYQPVTVANGVVYTLGNQGAVFAFDAATGNLLLERQLEGAGATCGSTAGAGLVVARNAVYAACDSAAAPTDDTVASLLPGLATGPQPGVLFALSL